MTGSLDIVGLGPGAREHRTAAATEALRAAATIVGYGPYIDLCADVLDDQELIRGTMGEEAARAEEAVGRAAAGERVALVSTGDPGIYGMAGRALRKLSELPEAQRPAVRVLPGVTAASAAGALLGAPLGDDFAVISLSDLRAPWERIERRIVALAGAGITLCLYNPRSAQRAWQLPRVLELLAQARPADTPVALIRDATRPGEAVTVTRLDSVCAEQVDMRTLLVVAGETTASVGEWLVAER